MKKTIEFISIVRFISVLMIVLCHIFQAYGNFLAFHFNVGVFTFLFISGFLFGIKVIDNVLEFYKKRIKRLIIPYYFFIISISIIYLLFFREKFGLILILKNLLCIQWFSEGLPKIGHLWYITCILICYLFTPILQKLFDSFSKRIMRIFLLVLFCVLVIANYILKYNFVSIYSYVLGYYVSRVLLQKRYDAKIPKKYLVLVIIVGMLAEIAVLSMNVISVSLPGVLVEISKLFVSSAIVSLCILIKNIYNKFPRLFLIVDKYSYEVYLTHHLWILGVFSLVKITKYISVNILLVIVLTMLSSLVLNFVSEKIMKLGV